ncbi:MAG: right-handed parallel beta-helix repeat-containing protein [Planctomycetes bacterium]|nr:right-handed parallel beta-helix repeat-containing protein [Planctomycetota bacterium]MCB9891981.1 right-handed parallel beta-helix repeat-containing protein [Planctomycetota bacterium]
MTPTPLVRMALLAALLPSGTRAQHTIHVAPNGVDTYDGATAGAPVASVERALERARARFATSPDASITVAFAPGTYRLHEPLRITPTDLGSPGGSLRFVGVPARTTLSGGRVVRGLIVDDAGYWRATLPVDVYGQHVRELFVNGVRARRARHPNTDWLRIESAFPDRRTGFVARPGDLPHVANLSTLELVFLHDWSITRVGVRELDPEAARLTTTDPIGGSAPHYAIDNFEKHPRYALENAREFLDEPGEWFFDEATRELVIVPRAGDDPSTTEIVVPRLERLVAIEGREDRVVENVQFEGLAFEHCAWPIPAKGYAEGQANYHEPRTGESGILREIVPAAFHVERARGIQVSNCTFRHLGTGGLWFGSRTASCQARGVAIEDVSSNGILLGEDTRRRVDGRPWWQSAPEQAARGHVVEDCRISHCGVQFHGAVGIWVGIASEMRIVDNEVHDVPYTGISLGWMWNPTPTPAGGHLVARNHIHHVMQLLSDGGGIYTLGAQPGTVLERNVIHDVPVNLGRAESNGMFLDEGTKHIVIRGNVIYGLDRSPLRFHRAEQNLVIDNLLVVRGDTPEIRYNTTVPETIEKVRNVVARER